MMFEIELTGQFKKDFKRMLKRGANPKRFETVIELLVSGTSLPSKYKDHTLSGNYIDNWDCHIEPDWVLIYKRDLSNKVIKLIRTGTHSDLF